MKKSITVKPKKRGRPATGRDPFVGVRLPKELIASIEKRAAMEGVTRSEAIRRLVEIALATSQPATPTGKRSASKARTIAAKEIDRLADQSAPVKEQQRRKRRLLKGPEEFRELRENPTSSKGRAKRKTSE
jgi:hypothetical protein